MSLERKRERDRESEREERESVKASDFSEQAHLGVEHGEEERGEDAHGTLGGWGGEERGSEIRKLGSVGSPVKFNHEIRMGAWRAEESTHPSKQSCGCGQVR